MSVLYIRGTDGEFYPVKTIRGPKGEQGHTPVKGTDYWTDADKTEIVEEVLEQIPNSGGTVSQGTGLSTTAANLLIEILESAVYNTNVSGKIASLKEALVSGGSSGGDDPVVPDPPDDPDEPVVVDDITVNDGSMTITTVGSEISVSNGVMTIA